MLLRSVISYSTFLHEKSWSFIFFEVEKISFEQEYLFCLRKVKVGASIKIYNLMEYEWEFEVEAWIIQWS